MKGITLIVGPGGPDDITLSGSGISPLEGIVALMEGAKLLSTGLARTITLDLGFKVVADRQGAGEFVEEDENVEQTFSEVAPSGTLSH